MHDFDGDARLSIDLSSHIESQIYWNGSYSRGELKVMDRFLGPGDTVVDIGANIGEFTIAAARRVSGGRVVAFEPVPFIYDRLSTNVAMNQLRNVSLVNRGVYRESCTRRIFISDGLDSEHTINQGMSNLFAPPQGSSGLSEEVELASLDDWWSENQPGRVDFMKLDIEGAELAALKGARGILDSYHPRLIVELDRENCEAAGVRPEDVVDYLGSFGYRIYAFSAGGELSPLDGGGHGFTRNIFCEA
jgi:FkbM family methyltransferase